MLLPRTTSILSLLSVLKLIASAPATISELTLLDNDTNQRHSHESLFQNIDTQRPFHVPSRYESTILGRRLMALSSTGTIATVFPKNLTGQRVPEEVSRAPIALPDYIASCEEPTGNPTLIALKISTTTRNAVAGSNASLSVSWWDEYTKLTHRAPWSQANLPRLSMVGYLEEISEKDVKDHGIVSCYTKIHPDSSLWLPGSKWSVHEGLWMRLVVQEVYWIGGFGDKNFIGWFNIDEWKSVKTAEWMEVRLPGEA